MKITCPNSPDHKVFSVMAHVTEEWIVDQSGDYIRSEGVGDVTHRPDMHDHYICCQCSADGIVYSDSDMVLCQVCGKSAEGQAETCECVCLTCGAHCFNDVDLADHGECRDCHHSRLHGEIQEEEE